MAKPSLEIGNNKWAIKEDNLLGYGISDGVFVPQPITMTRASAGTRVNSAGLVETVELLGSEEITNGDFANWTGDNPDNFQVLNENAANYVTESSNQLRMVSDNSATIAIRPQPTSMLTVGKIYKVSVDLTFTTGSIDISGNSFNTSGTKVFYINAGATYLQIAKTSALDVLIDNVSVKEVTRNNLARVDYTDGTSSLLAEPERINLVTYSEPTSSQGSDSNISYESFNWGVIGFTEATVFDGSLNPFSYMGTSTASTVWTLSCFVKMDDLSEPMVGLGGSNDFRTVIGNTQDGTNVISKIDFGNNVWKISATNTTSAANLNNNGLRVLSNSGKSFRATGFQLEQGSYATSYIPTDGTTVTRVKDQYEKTGISNLINSEEGVLFVEMALLGDDDSNKYMSISDGTDDNKIQIDFDYSLSRLQYVVKSETAVQVNLKLSYTGTNMDKIAVKWKVNDFSVWLNGVEIGTDTLGDAPIGLNTLKLSAPAGSNYFEGKVKQLQVYDTALTDSELETLTT